MAEDTAPQETPADMSGDDTEDMDAVADRLEAALERIARHLDAARMAPDCSRARGTGGRIDRAPTRRSGTPAGPLAGLRSGPQLRSAGRKDTD